MIRSPPAVPPAALTRRIALALTSGLLWGGDRAEPLRAVLEGDGDPHRALAGLVGVGFVTPRAPAKDAFALGRAHIDPDRPITVDTPMRVASISKHVTTLGFLKLLEARKVGLNDDLSDHLGFRLRHPRFPDHPLTPQMVLSHTSGLRNGPSYPVPFGRPLSSALIAGGEAFDQGGWWSPDTEPPGWFAYADVNFAVVAQVIERISGERFDRYMSREIFRPLGLQCGFNWSGSPQSVRDHLGTLYRKGADEDHFDPDGPWVAQVDASPSPASEIPVARSQEAHDRPLETYAPGENGFVFSPQGGLRASVNDLARIARVLANAGSIDGLRLLSPQTVALMQTPVWIYDPDRPNGAPYGGGGILAYGLGTSILTGTDQKDGDDLFIGSKGWVGHLGEAYGLLSGLWINPRSGAGMVYMISGVSSPAAQNRGARSAFTWQEERLATALTP